MLVRIQGKETVFFNKFTFHFYYGWIIAVVVFLAEFTTSGMGGSTISLFFEPMRQSMGWSLTALVGAVSAQNIAGMITTPFIGILLDRYGARPIMFFGAIFAGVGLILLATVNHIWQFWVIYAVVAALGMNELGRLSSSVVISKWFIKRRGRAMAFAMAGNGAGAMVMSPIIAFCILDIGWRLTWALLGVITLVLMIPPVLIFMKRQPEDVGLNPDGESLVNINDSDTSKVNIRASDIEVQWSVKEALKSKVMWILIFSISLMNLPVVPLVLLQVPFFINEGMSEQMASMIFSLSWIAFTISRFIWGFVTERIPVRICLSGMAFFRSLGVILLVVVPYPYNIFPFLLLSGLLGGAMTILMPILFATYFGRSSAGGIQGSIRPLLGISQLLAPIIVSWYFDKTGSFNITFFAFGVLGLVGAAIALLAKPPIHNMKSSHRDK
jgi:MFS family permease